MHRRNCDIVLPECNLRALLWKGGSTMRENLEVALGWLERAASVVMIVVPATRKVVSLFESDTAE